MNSARQTGIACKSAGPAPLRVRGSVRRTSSIDTEWPEGRSGPMRVRGRARDLYTSREGEARILAEASFEALLSPRREILRIEADPPRAEVAALVGTRCGGHLRAELERVLLGEGAKGTPLHFILDDLAGASLVANWAWSHRVDKWLEVKTQPTRMEGVCTGFAPGSSALTAEGTAAPNQSSARVGPLANPLDPSGWHPLADQPYVGMRRGRRIDVWLRDPPNDVIEIDSGFQDSASMPDGGRLAIHEYVVRATASRKDETILSLDAYPCVLPYIECPGAVANIGRLNGASLSALRKFVIEQLRGTAGCTHLNDALRALADAPQLLALAREHARLT